MFTGSAVDHIITAMDRAFEDGTGFTINALTGETFIPQQDCYVVGGVIPELLVSQSSTTLDQIEEWYTLASIVSSSPLVGGWMYQGIMHLDLVTVTTNVEQALILGRSWNQISVGALDTTGAFTELEVA